MVCFLLKFILFIFNINKAFLGEKTVVIVNYLPLFYQTKALLKNIKHKHFLQDKVYTYIWKNIY